jgi:hypothetical protein
MLDHWMIEAVRWRAVECRKLDIGTLKLASKFCESSKGGASHA